MSLSTLSVVERVSPLTPRQLRSRSKIAKGCHLSSVTRLPINKSEKSFSASVGVRGSSLLCVEPSIDYKAPQNSPRNNACSPREQRPTTEKEESLSPSPDLLPEDDRPLSVVGERFSSLSRMSSAVIPSQTGTTASLYTHPKDRSDMGLSVEDSEEGGPEGPPPTPSECSIGSFKLDGLRIGSVCETRCTQSSRDFNPGYVKRTSYCCDKCAERMTCHESLAMDSGSPFHTYQRYHSAVSEAPGACTQYTPDNIRQLLDTSASCTLYEQQRQFSRLWGIEREQEKRPPSSYKELASSCKELVSDRKPAFSPSCKVCVIERQQDNKPVAENESNYPATPKEDVEHEVVQEVVAETVTESQQQETVCENVVQPQVEADTVTEILADTTTKVVETVEEGEQIVKSEVIDKGSVEDVKVAVKPEPEHPVTSFWPALWNPNPPSGVPSSGVPSSGVLSSGVPSSGVPSSGVPSSGVPSSGIPSYSVPSSGVPSSGVPSSGVPSSGIPSSGVPSSSAPSSGVPSSGIPSSGVPSSSAPSSGVPSSGVPSSGVPTSGVPHNDRPIASPTASMSNSRDTLWSSDTVLPENIVKTKPRRAGSAPSDTGKVEIDRNSNTCDDVTPKRSNTPPPIFERAKVDKVLQECADIIDVPKRQLLPEIHTVPDGSELCYTPIVDKRYNRWKRRRRKRYKADDSIAFKSTSPCESSSEENKDNMLGESSQSNVKLRRRKRLPEDGESWDRDSSGGNNDLHYDASCEFTTSDNYTEDAGLGGMHLTGTIEEHQERIRTAIEQRDKNRQEIFNCHIPRQRNEDDLVRSGTPLLCTTQATISRKEHSIPLLSKTAEVDNLSLSKTPKLPGFKTKPKSTYSGKPLPFQEDETRCFKPIDRSLVFHATSDTGTVLKLNKSNPSGDSGPSSGLVRIKMDKTSKERLLLSRLARSKVIPGGTIIPRKRPVSEVKFPSATNTKSTMPTLSLNHLLRNISVPKNPSPSAETTRKSHEDKKGRTKNTTLLVPDIVGLQKQQEGISVENTPKKEIKQSSKRKCLFPKRPLLDLMNKAYFKDIERKVRDREIQRTRKISSLSFTPSFSYSLFELPEIYKKYNKEIESRVARAWSMAEKLK